MHYRIFVNSILMLLASHLIAADGDPAAIRTWPGGAVSIENHWGLHLVIDGNELSARSQVRKPDRAVLSSEEISHRLYRLPNQESVIWRPLTAGTVVDENQIVVRSLGNGIVVVEFDGLSVVVAKMISVMADSAIPPHVDALVIDISGPQENGGKAQPMIDLLNPRLIVPLYSQPSGDADLQRLIKATNETKQLSRVAHNTIAICKSEEASLKPQVVVLGTAPWQMPKDLMTQFDAMEKSCRDSQNVFMALSVKQMNFKPSNGTHTPRWNTEHMMGRQLQFFSQIYHAIDPTIPVMDLNPKQMPPDYEFANPDWTGAEEARQMQRVSDFCRRYAYLLEGLDLDKKAPGSRWPTLRALLEQMRRHYSEHTANTIKKFDLPDWPKS